MKDLIAHTTNAGRNGYRTTKIPEDTRPWDRHKFLPVFDKFRRAGRDESVWEGYNILILKKLVIPDWVMQVPTFDPFTIMRFLIPTYSFRRSPYQKSLIFLTNRDLVRFTLMAEGDIQQSLVATYCRSRYSLDSVVLRSEVARES